MLQIGSQTRALGLPCYIFLDNCEAGDTRWCSKLFVRTQIAVAAEPKALFSHSDRASFIVVDVFPSLSWSHFGKKNIKLVPTCR